MTSIDTLVAQAVYRAHLMESALHDKGPWEIQVGDAIEPAHREITETEVIFTAWFTDVSGDLGTAYLLHDGDVIGAKPIDGTDGIGHFGVRWGIGAVLSTV